MTLTEAAEAEYPLDDPRKNMFHDNMGQYDRRDAFVAGANWQASQPSGQGMRGWEKHTQKPKQDGTYLCKFYTDPYHAQMGCEYLEFKDGAFQVEHNEYYNLKWLDEAPTPESQWLTEEEIEAEAKYRYPRDDKYDAHVNTIAKFEQIAFKAAIQWLQTSAETREAELEKCLGEIIKVYDDFIASEQQYISLTEVITKAKSLLNPDKTDL